MSKLDLGRELRIVKMERAIRRYCIDAVEDSIARVSAYAQDSVNDYTMDDDDEAIRRSRIWKRHVALQGEKS